MTVGESGTLYEILRRNEESLLPVWLDDLKASGSTAGGRISESELGRQAQEFFRLLMEAAKSGGALTSQHKEWQEIREFLDGISRSRAAQGISSDQTALFLFSFKRPLFSVLRKEFGQNPELLATRAWEATELLDQLGLYTVQSFQKTREDIIIRQQEELLELSTPVVKLWEGVLALPIIGTLDSARTQIVMESLLQRIVETGSELAIIDITGVPTVDTLVAQHLLKTVTAIRLMGAECVVSGVRPQIAQTIVHLGVDLQGVTTKANLADALRLALKRLGYTCTKSKD